MTNDRNLERALRTWLADGLDQLPDRHLDAALDEISTTTQRRRLTPAWRFLDMNPRTKFGLTAAAVALVLIASATVASHYGLLNIGTPTPSPAVLAGQIVFTSNRDAIVTDTDDLYLMKPDGTGVTRVTQSSGKHSYPALSPDGGVIAYVNGTTDPPQLYLVNRDGGGEIALTHQAGGGIWGPTWSPDGRKIAFSSDRSGSWQVYIINADGSGETQLTNFGKGNSAGSFSPDGSRIIFASGFLDGSSDIAVMNVDGTGLGVLVHLNLFSYNDPHYSPDGSQIVLSRGPEIYLMNADGSGITRLTDQTTYQEWPRWSPNGSQIVFSRRAPGVGAGDIWIMNVDGSGAMSITTGPANDWGADWR